MIHLSIYLLSFIYNLILYSIQWQASYHGNWSCHANKPASIWIMQIIKSLHTVAEILVGRVGDRPPPPHLDE
jgi:hypothetical protein